MSDIIAYMFLLRGVIPYIFAVAGAIGAAQIAATREDAFEAANRKPKWFWFAMVAGSSLAMVLGVWLINIIALVILGVYFFDVRPQIKSILDGSSSW
ncbi:DUF2516 family protein [Corynebacterium mendelii]|uniref:DUF2516 family protein n=1 Tax=Corynebacterium mendelii TaxID=2765362 RepID=A0A939E161_9CORY|nr:DUF2516 family protein [Corynebacterium mendelii]MBN9643816.1 DUF2516 family protein [Corynebacterium mendelii]